MMHWMLALSIMATFLVPTGCTGTHQSHLHSLEHEEGHHHAHHQHGGHHQSFSHHHSHVTPDKAFVQVGEYYFKLVPYPQKDGSIIFDLYLHNAENQHVSGAHITLHLLRLDGTQEEAAFQESAEHHHYQGQIQHLSAGTYQAVARTTLNDSKLNARFQFAID